MRILVNAASAHMGGAVTYLRNLIEWLPRVSPDARLFLYVPNTTADKLENPDRARLTITQYPHARTDGMSRLHFDQVAIPRLARMHDADVLYSTTGFGTLKPGVPQVLLVRNLAYFDPLFRQRYRELGRSLARNRVRRWHSLASILAADTVFFPTRAMRDLVAPLAPRARDRLRVNHYGFDRSAISRSNPAQPPDLPVERWRSEGRKILLNVSTFSVQKNFETLVEALPLIKSGGVRVKVILTISRDQTTDKREFDALLRRARELGVEEELALVGYVPYEQLAQLYQQADAYVFPSFTESFGHSMVEAMACGLPVVAADTPTNREICGRAGEYFGTFDANECARTISSLLSSPGRMHGLAEASQARADVFSWERHFHVLMESFDTLLSGRPHMKSPRGAVVEA